MIIPSCYSFGEVVECGRGTVAGERWRCESWMLAGQRAWTSQRHVDEDLQILLLNLICAIRFQFSIHVYSSWPSTGFLSPSSSQGMQLSCAWCETISGPSSGPFFESKFNSAPCSVQLASSVATLPMFLIQMSKSFLLYSIDGSRRRSMLNSRFCSPARNLAVILSPTWLHTKSRSHQDTRG